MTINHIKQEFPKPQKKIAVPRNKRVPVTSEE